MRSQIIIGMMLLLSGLMVGHIITSLFESEDLNGPYETCSSTTPGMVYSCAMHPHMKNRMAGKCLVCGMDMVLRQELEKGSSMALAMTDEATRLSGISTQPVVCNGKEVRSGFNTVAEVTIPASATYRQMSYLPGRIDEWYIEGEGTYVRKGQLIAKVFSKELIAVIEAFKYSKTSASVLRAAENNLRAWKIDKARIMPFLKGNEDYRKPFEIYADRSGYIANIMAAEGAVVGGHTGHDNHLFDIIEVAKMELKAPVPANKLYALEAIDKIDLSTLDGTRIGTAKYDRLLRSTSGSGATFDVMIKPTWTVDVPLVRGMRFEATFEINQASNLDKDANCTYYIPQNSVVSMQNASYVFIASSDDGISRYTPVKVQIVSSDDSGIYISSPEIYEEQRIAISGIPQIYAGLELQGAFAPKKKSTLQSIDESQASVLWKSSNFIQ